MAKKKLQGQVAILSGGGRGIGAAAAARLAAGGAKLVLVARTEQEVELVAAGLRRQGAQALAVVGDISDPEVVEEVVETALEQYNRVDILVNNAAVLWPFEEIAESDPEEWAYNIAVNLIAPYWLVRNVLPVMLDQGSGRILAVGDGTAPLAGASAYLAAKAGLEMWMRVLAMEVAGSGVSANLLDPGAVDSALQEDLRTVDTTGTRLDTTCFHELHEGGRLQSPAQIGELIYWLVGPWGRAYNGERFSASDQAWRQRVAADLA
jgi:NAD(P)-dependent dehydrogenase (short-subunit alcohol dehydrogenase family)